jgi:hypothetical protein
MPKADLKFGEPPARNGRDTHAADFIAQADTRGNRPRTRGRPPVESPSLDFLNDDDRRRVNTLNLRMTDREKRALAFLIEGTSDSLHLFCMRAVREEIRRRLADNYERELGDWGNL